MRINADSNLNLNVVVTRDLEQSYKGISTLKNMLPHQTIAGEVTEIRDGMAKVSIGEDAFFWARTGQNSTVAPGQTMILELLNAGNNQITLRPLYQNLNHDQNLMKALDAAGLPDSARNLEMAALRMEDGMPLDKNSLLAESRELMSHPEALVRDIHMLGKMNLPVNDVSLNMMETLRNQESMLMSRTDAISSDAVQVLRALLGAENESPVAAAGNGQEATLQQPVALAENPAATQTAGNPEAEEAADQSKIMQQLPAGPEEAVLNEKATGEVRPLMQPPLVEGQETEPAQRTANDANAAAEGTKTVLSEEQIQILKEGLSDRSFRYATDLLKGFDGGGEVLAKTAQALQEGGREHALDVFKNEFSELLKNSWSLRPEDFNDKESIGKYYEKVYTQAEHISRTSQQAQTGAGTLVQNLSGAAGEISDNLNFLNQMNQVVSFAQIPVTLQGGGKGELYVMASKKGGGEDDDKTAYLKLDMDHLGKVECGIRINKEQLVQTNFVLENEELLDFVEQYLPMLDDRLKERGYTTRTNARVRDENSTENILDDIASCLGTTNLRVSVMNAYGFDVRA